MELFVDTGMTGAIVVFCERKPIGYYPFKKNKGGIGIELKRLKAWLCQYKNAHVIVEDPAKISRSMTTVAPQWFVVGQIYTLVESISSNVVWINSNSWQAFIRRELQNAPKDTKEMARMWVKKRYPEFINEHWPAKKTIPSGVADAACLADYFYFQGDKFLEIL